jgi:hypothetical protein
VSNYAEYLSLLQAAAVTVVACSLILSGAADLFAIDNTANKELGGVDPVRIVRFKGAIANATRWLVVGTGGFLAAAYTAIAGVIIFSIFDPGISTASGLSKHFLWIVSSTIFFVCWIACLGTFLRWRHMRRTIHP